MTLSGYFKFPAKITKEIILLGIVSSTTILLKEQFSKEQFSTTILDYLLKVIVPTLLRNYILKRVFCSVNFGRSIE